MKTLSILCLLLPAALSVSHLSFAQDPDWVSASVETADPHCLPDHSVTLHTVLEFQNGLWAWRPVGHFEICVNNGGTSEIHVHFKDEPYQAVISINGKLVDLAPTAETRRFLEYTRQDFIGDHPSAPPSRVSFVLEQGHSTEFRLGGHYDGQERNLRLRISY